MKMILAIASMFLSMSSCSSSYDEVLDRKVEAEAGSSDATKFREKMNKLVEGEPHMTTAQRERINSLRMEMMTKMDRMNTQSYELRSVLLKDLLAPTYDRREVSQIKDRIKALEDRKLSLLFESSDQARKILGRESMVYPEIVREFVRIQDERGIFTEMN